MVHLPAERPVGLASRKRKVEDLEGFLGMASLLHRIQEASTPLRPAKRRSLAGDASAGETGCPAEGLVGSSKLESEMRARGPVLPLAEIAAVSEEEDGKVVEAAFALFKEFIAEFDKTRAKFPKTGSERASAQAEQRMTERYEEIRSVFVQLLRRVSTHAVSQTSQHLAGDRPYEVVRVQGHSARAKSREQLKSLDSETLERELRRSRGKGSGDGDGQLREALCAALAVLAARREMCWFEAFEGERCYPHAYFTPKLVDRSAVLRIALAPSPVPRPASLIVTYLATFGEALAQMDDNGPLRIRDCRPSWCRSAGRQFALQELQTGVEIGSRDERVPARLLKPEPKLRELLCSKTQVLVLEVYAALAPRHVSKEQGLSPIVKAELASVLREAKAAGRAVVFACGGEDPHKLAEKVYLQAPFTDFGLRCGYLRWRDSPDAPWSREKRWDARVCIGVQLP
eukprot:TRINITY_DN5372_c0_g3_i2.p1 TRINITY_DN5372_c0_g3~~TRINITY_DN5372_c0_g3_i2.p1  ORF type:complete len:486 (-),score=92.15 TRINITY_DN5372_c0_g3_i2:331-1701(-)